MKSILMTVALFLSFNAFADLEENTNLSMQYQEVAVLSVESIQSNVKYTPDDFAAYSGNVMVTAVVEGNLCGSEASTAGTMTLREGEKKFIKVVAGRAHTDQIVGCPQYSQPTTVQFAIPVFGFERGEENVQSLGTIVLSRYSSNSTTSAIEIIMKTKGPSIEISKKEISDKFKL